MHVATAPAMARRVQSWCDSWQSKANGQCMWSIVRLNFRALPACAWAYAGLARGGENSKTASPPLLTFNKPCYGPVEMPLGEISIAVGGPLDVGSAASGRPSESRRNNTILQAQQNTAVHGVRVRSSLPWPLMLCLYIPELMPNFAV